MIQKEYQLFEEWFDSLSSEEQEEYIKEREAENMQAFQNI